MEKLTPNQCSSKEYFDIHHKKKNISWRQNTMQSCRGILKTLNSDMRKHKILDMGCGSGEFVKVCQEKGADNVVGVDISITGLKMAKGIGAGKLIIADQENLPFKRNIFSHVLFLTSLEYSMHENNIQKALNEARRVSEQRAFFYIETRNADFILFKFFKISRPARYANISYYRWLELFKSAGLAIDKTWKSYKPIFPLCKFSVKTFVLNIVNFLSPTRYCYSVFYLCHKK